MLTPVSPFQKILDNTPVLKLKSMLLLRPSGAVPLALLNDPNITEDKVRKATLTSLSSSEMTALALHVLGIDEAVKKLNLKSPPASLVLWIQDYLNRSNSSRLNPLRTLHILLFNTIRQMVHSCKNLIIVNNKEVLLNEDEWVDLYLDEINNIFCKLNSYLRDGLQEDYDYAVITINNTFKPFLSKLLKLQNEMSAETKKLVVECFRTITQFSMILQDPTNLFPLLLEPCKTDFAASDTIASGITFLKEVDQFYNQQLTQLFRHVNMIFQRIDKKSYSSIVTRRFYNSLELLTELIKNHIKQLSENYLMMAKPITESLNKYNGFVANPMLFFDKNSSLLLLKAQFNHILQTNFDAKNSFKQKYNELSKKCLELASAPEFSKILSSDILKKLKHLEIAFITTCDAAHKIGNDICSGLYESIGDDLILAEEVKKSLEGIIDPKWRGVKSQTFCHADLIILTLLEKYQEDKAQTSDKEALARIFETVLNMFVSLPLLPVDIQKIIHFQKSISTLGISREIYQKAFNLGLLLIKAPLTGLILLSPCGENFELNPTDTAFTHQFINHLKLIIEDRDLHCFEMKLTQIGEKTAELQQNIEYLSIQELLTKIKQFIHIPCPDLPLHERIELFFEECINILLHSEFPLTVQNENLEETFLHLKSLFFNYVIKHIIPLYRIRFALSIQQSKTKPLTKPLKKLSFLKPKIVPDRIEAEQVATLTVPKKAVHITPELLSAYSLFIGNQLFQSLKPSKLESEFLSFQSATAKNLHHACLKLEGQYQSSEPSTKQIILQTSVILEQSLKLALVHACQDLRDFSKFHFKVLKEHQLTFLFNYLSKLLPASKIFELSEEESVLLYALDHVIPTGARYERHANWEEFPPYMLEVGLSFAVKILNIVEQDLSGVQISITPPGKASKVPPVSDLQLAKLKEQFSSFQEKFFQMRGKLDWTFKNQAFVNFLSLERILKALESSNDYDDQLLYLASLFECTLLMTLSLNNESRLFNKIGDRPLMYQHQLGILLAYAKEKIPHLNLDASILGDMEDLIKNGYRYLPNPNCGYVTKEPATYITQTGSQILALVIDLIKSVK